MSEFHIEDMGGVKVVVYQDGSCGPATDVEIEQDATIAALREEVERLKAGYPPATRSASSDSC